VRSTRLPAAATALCSLSCAPSTVIVRSAVRPSSSDASGRCASEGLAAACSPAADVEVYKIK
jgi:hypothetical protein